MGVIFITCVIYPYIVDILTIMGASLYSFNAYIIPFLLAYKMNNINKRNLVKRIYFSCFFIVSCLSILSLYEKIY